MIVGRNDSMQSVRAVVGADGDVIVTLTDEAGCFADLVLDPIEALAVSRMIANVAERAGSVYASPATGDEDANG